MNDPLGQPIKISSKDPLSVVNRIGASHSALTANCIEDLNDKLTQTSQSSMKVTKFSDFF